MSFRRYNSLKLVYPHFHIYDFTKTIWTVNSFHSNHNCTMKLLFMDAIAYTVELD